jgi:hypothetical protein
VIVFGPWFMANFGGGCIQAGAPSIFDDIGNYHSNYHYKFSGKTD